MAEKVKKSLVMVVVTRNWRIVIIMSRIVIMLMREALVIVVIGRCGSLKPRRMVVRWRCSLVLPMTRLEFKLKGLHTFLHDFQLVPDRRFPVFIIQVS